MTREVRQGPRYQFAVIVPKTVGMLDAQKALEARGWELTSIGAPAGGVADAVRNFMTLGFDTPNAWTAIGKWTRPPTVIPERDGQLYYAPIFVEYTDVGPLPGLPGDTTKPHDGGGAAAASEPSALSWLLLGAVGAAGILGVVYLASRSVRRPLLAEDSFGMRYDSSFDYRGVRVNINRRGDAFCPDIAGVVRLLPPLKISRAWSVIHGVGCGADRDGAVWAARRAIDQVLAS